jgi:hypothetical protein
LIPFCLFFMVTLMKLYCYGNFDEKILSDNFGHVGQW